MATANIDVTKITFLDLTASYSHVSLALPMLHLACQDVDAEWSVARGTVNDAIDSVVHKTVDHAPNVLLATVYLFNHEILTKVLARVHRLLPNCTIILGGPEFLGNNETFLQRHPCVTAVVRGEGEEVLPTLLRRIQEGRPLHTDGVCLIDADGAYHDAGTAPRATWPPARLPFESEFYDTSRAFVQIESSRGCNQSCRFCTSAHTGGPEWLPIADLKRWLEAVRTHGIKEVRLLDRTFNASTKDAHERLELFRHSFPDLRFHLEIHPAFLTDVIRHDLALAEPGQLHLEAGLQTTDAHVMKTIGRAGNSKSTVEGVAFLCDLESVEIHADLIVGLPGQTLDHVITDVQTLVSLAPEEIQIETLKILAGTDLARTANDLGIHFAPDPPYEVLETPAMTFAEIGKAMKLSRIIDRFFNAPMLNPVIKALGQRSPTLLIRTFDELISRHAADTPISLRRRALLLHLVLTESNATAAASQLACQWLTFGLSPSQCPGNATRWKAPIPKSARLTFSLPDFQIERGQLWTLEHADGHYWFLFDKAITQAGPAAIFKTP